MSITKKYLPFAVAIVLVILFVLVMDKEYVHTVIVGQSNFINTNNAFCRTLPLFSKSTKSRKVILGGMSFVGSKLSFYLHNKGERGLQVIEDITNVDKDRMKWYRWTKLNQIGVQLNITENSQILKLLDNNESQDIVYIPSVLFNTKLASTSRLIKTLKNFAALLDQIKNKLRTSLIVILPREHSWSNVFEYTLEAYINTGCVYASSVQLKGVYGPWQDITSRERFEKSLKSLYINDVLDVIDHYHSRFWNDVTELSSLLQQEMKNRVRTAAQHDASLSLTLKWIEEYANYINKQQRSVALSGTLRLGGKYYQHTNTLEEINTANLFRYFNNWLMSAHKVKMDTVVFSDVLSDEFILRASSHFERTEFTKVTTVSKRSPNDKRFYIIYNYLLSHPEIKLAVTTDSRDVRFVNNPTTVMEAVGDYYFIGSDMSFYLKSGQHGWLRGFMEACLPNSPLKERTYELQGFFNSGVLGGTRARMLNLLSHMIVLFDKTNPRTICDMSVLGIVSHSEDFYDEVYYGYPYNTAFKGGIKGPFGIAIKHKS